MNNNNDDRSRSIKDINVEGILRDIARFRAIAAATPNPNTDSLDEIRNRLSLAIDIPFGEIVVDEVRKNSSLDDLQIATAAVCANLIHVTALCPSDVSGMVAMMMDSFFHAIMDNTDYSEKPSSVPPRRKFKIIKGGAETPLDPKPETV